MLLWGAAPAPAFCEMQARMTIRSRREVVTFRHPFRIRGIDRLLPAGAYEVVTDEETIEGLSFEAFRRAAWATSSCSSLLNPPSRARF
jgi:hypothetical protein